MNREKNKATVVISILILITTLRTAAGTLIPNLEMFGGNLSNAWSGPFFADVVLGVMAPFVAYLAWKKVGKRLWGFLVVYNAVGAFDYLQGLVISIHSPNPANPNMTFPLVLFMTLQITILLLLFRKDVVEHYLPN